ncbi:unnamed protein product [Effrenium voratum]|nr:unnamed protein product [Effrenium voratum]
MTKPKGGDELLREEFKALLQAQSTWTQELQALTEQRDQAMQRAQKLDLEIAAEQEALDDLERECHSFDVRLRNAKAEEERMRREAADLAAENGRSERKGAPAVDPQELRALREELAQERQRAEREDEAQERATRARVEEQCMLLRALHDMVTDSGQLSKADNVRLVQQLAHVKLEEHPLTWSLLRQQAEKHGAFRRELLECCNQELRRRQWCASELLEEESLPRLLAALQGEGILEGYSPPSAQSGQRLRQLRK